MPKITKAGGATNRYTYPLGILPSQADGSIPEEPNEGPVADAPLTERPPHSARKHVWEAYAESQGHDPAGLSKRKLIALVS